MSFLSRGGPGRENGLAETSALATSTDDAKRQGNGNGPGGYTLEVQGLSKSFGGLRALSEVSFGIRAGEVVGLVGDNGAGKSTLVKCVSGLHRHDSGEIVIDEQVQDHVTPEAMRDAGVEAVQQHLALVETMDVAANLFLNREQLRTDPVRRTLRWMDQRRMYRAADEILVEMGVHLGDLRRPVSMLSGGQRQMLAVARALYWKPRVVLLDEPTAALGVEKSHQVLHLVRHLAKERIAVLLISHSMADVMDVTDRVVVLRLGTKVAELRTHDTNAEMIISYITGAANPTAGS